jgi:hypothetical protein
VVKYERDQTRSGTQMLVAVEDTRNRDREKQRYKHFIAFVLRFAAGLAIVHPSLHHGPKRPLLDCL